MGPANPVFSPLRASPPSSCSANLPGEATARGHAPRQIRHPKGSSHSRNRVWCLTWHERDSRIEPKTNAPPSKHRSRQVCIHLNERLEREDGPNHDDGRLRVLLHDPSAESGITPSVTFLAAKRMTVAIIGAKDIRVANASHFRLVRGDHQRPRPRPCRGKDDRSA